MKIQFLSLLVAIAATAAAHIDADGMETSDSGKKDSSLVSSMCHRRKLNKLSIRDQYLRNGAKNVFTSQKAAKGVRENTNQGNGNGLKVSPKQTLGHFSSKSKGIKSKGSKSKSRGGQIKEIVKKTFVHAPTLAPKGPTDSPSDPTVAPSEISLLPPTEPTQTPVSSTSLEVDMMGPGAAFANQEISFTILVTNVGTDVEAINVVLEIELPTEGSFVGSDPEGTVSGNTLSVDLDNLAPSASKEVELRWQAPDNEVTLTSQATAKADNANEASDNEEVQVGASSTVTGGVASGGTGLRNRSGGTISIKGIPSGASVTRAVLVWALLYDSPTPSNQITFEGESVTTDLTATISQSLCWGDQNTIGYATDVTSLVKGNGEYVISDAINGEIREDSSPSGALPFTDGASLFVFYGGPGINDQVISDFTYSAASDSTMSNDRSLTGITSIGGTATLHLAGPDGQSGGGEQMVVAGDGTLNFDNSWDGSAPQSGPDFAGGNLWDNDIHDVSLILPAGQTTLDVSQLATADCVGLSAVALQVEQ